MSTACTGPAPGGTITIAGKTVSRLGRLGVDELDLCYLHRIDPTVSAEDQVGELRALQQEGKSTTSACRK